MHLNHMNMVSEKSSDESIKDFKKESNEEKNVEVPVMNDHKVVVLSGSMKFWDTFIEVAHYLSEQGYIVLTPFADRNPEYIDEAKAKMYDDQHRKRIDMADMMFVINKGCYMGKSTLSEIKYAQSKKKPIMYLEQPNHITVITICGSRKFIDIINAEAMRLRKIGKIVFTPQIFDFDVNEIKQMADKGAGTISMLELFDEIHNQKIEMSDLVYIINKDGYIGEDTMREIEYAKMHGKTIDYYYKPNVQ